MPFILLVTALIRRRNKLLILQRSKRSKTNKNRWQFPEGKVKHSESLLDALKREIKEETNFDLVKARLYGVHLGFLKIGYGKIRVLRILFECKVKGNLKLSKEHQSFSWVSEKDLEEVEFVKGFSIEEVIK
jgi:8-oxo-dGTP diphosphatase